MEDKYYINEAIKILKEGAILTTNNNNHFIYKNEKFYHYFNGSLIKLDLNNFIEIYKKEVFYLYEENGTFIDDSKDEDYYRYYKK